MQKDQVLSKEQQQYEKEDPLQNPNFSLFNFDNELSDLNEFENAHSLFFNDQISLQNEPPDDIFAVPAPKSSIPQFLECLEPTSPQSPKTPKEKLPKNIEKLAGNEENNNEGAEKSCGKKVGRKRLFTEEEDNKLTELVQQFGESAWATIAKHMPGRTRKQLRDHYVNLVKRKNCTKEFTTREDAIILHLIKSEGRQWNKISEYLPGHSPAAIKNRYYCRLKKYLKTPNNIILRSHSVSVSCSDEDGRKSYNNLETSFISDSTDGVSKNTQKNIIKIKLSELELQKVLENASKKCESLKCTTSENV